MTEEVKTCQKSGLRDLDLLPEYNPDDNDIIAELYAPCLRVSERYDRAVGFFRASIYRELGVNLLDFAIRGGKTRLICSPDLPEPDENAAREGYALRGNRTFEEQETSLVSVFEAMSSSPDEAECLEMLRLLIEKGSFDLFIATRPGGIFHRKIGLFADSNGDMIVFSGSGNETQKAVSTEDWVNDEEFDIYRSWGDDFEKKKAQRKADYLDKLLKGGTKRTRVRPLNEVEREVLNRFRKYSSLEDCRPEAEKRLKLSAEPVAINLRFYQEEAISAWEKASCRGILSMATGTGKTITALFAIRQLLLEGYLILILVPTEALFKQWKENIVTLYPEIPILLAGAGNDWKSNDSKRMYISDVRLPRMILATMRTASSEDFFDFVGQNKEIVLIADEVHRLGSTMQRRILQLKFKAAIGLSATPERLFDKEGNEALARAFGEKSVYDLPMNAKVKLKRDDERDVPVIGYFLSPYYYDFELVHLAPTELEQWQDITLKIKREIAKNPKIMDNFDSSGDLNRLKFLLIERARIVKNAIGKVDVAEKIVSERYPKDGRWIIYCEDENQLNMVTARLRASHPNIPILTYHSKMLDIDLLGVWSYFESNPSIIVSIRCLDEGVDFPAADGAVILASSKNPREYIQRRGRVLRKAKGKKSAQIIDAIVVPPDDMNEKDLPFSIIRSELARAYVFAQDSFNPEVTHRLWRVCESYGVTLQTDILLSLQDEEWEE
jgi:superfamily II DNA or RNA helicase